MSSAMTYRSTARITREAKLSAGRIPRPPSTTHRVAEPIVVEMAPPRLTLSPSRVAPGSTDTLPPTATASPSTRAPGSKVTEPPIATASCRT